jgi:hypothetical protein
MLKVIGEEVKSRSDICCIFSRYGSALRCQQTIEDGGVRRKKMDGSVVRGYRTEQEVDQRGKDEIQGDYDGRIRQYVQGVRRHVERGQRGQGSCQSLIRLLFVD